MTNVAVIGAGPAGLSAAYSLAKQGIAVEVFEAGPLVGGLAQSVEMWGQCVDLGSHIFIPHDRRVNDLWSEVVGSDSRPVGLRRGIWLERIVFEYPVGFRDLVDKLGALRSIKFGLSALVGRIGRTKADDSAEDWVVHRFGRKFFDSFFRDYGEKLMGLPCKEIESGFASSLLSNVGTASIGSYLRNQLKARTGRVHASDRSSHRPVFQYPAGGMGGFSDRIASGLERLKVPVVCSTRVEELWLAGSRVQGIKIAGTYRKYDWVISSMPLPALVRALPNAPGDVVESARVLRSRHTVLVYLHAETADTFPHNWLYIYGSKYRMGRVTNFANWPRERPQAPSCASSTTAPKVMSCGALLTGH